MNFKLATIEHRPVPLEVHILISQSDEEKIRQIIKLVHEELKLTSSKGYRGQTIVFTNSRRKVNDIVDRIGNSFPRARPYHSGMTYSSRKRVEMEFSSGKCPVVVATYALGAGVDFPASQVIFESLMMGKDILSPNMFHQRRKLRML